MSLWRHRQGWKSFYSFTRTLNEFDECIKGCEHVNDDIMKTAAAVVDSMWLCSISDTSKVLIISLMPFLINLYNYLFCYVDLDSFLWCMYRIDKDIEKILTNEDVRGKMGKALREMSRYRYNRTTGDYAIAYDTFCT